MTRDAAAQALRDYELKNDMRAPWQEQSEHVKDTWRQAYARLAACLKEHGCKIVPIEPTEEMVVAGDEVLEDCKDSGWDSGSDGESHNSYECIIPVAQTKIYRAMIDVEAARARINYIMAGGDGW